MSWAPVMQGEPARERRMIRMRMGDDDPPNGGAGRRHDGVQVARIVGPRIEHRYLARTQQVAVGAGSRHQTRIAGDDAPHARREGHDLLGGEFGSGLRAHFMHLN